MNLEHRFVTKWFVVLSDSLSYYIYLAFPFRAGNADTGPSGSLGPGFHQMALPRFSRGFIR